MENQVDYDPIAKTSSITSEESSKSFTKEEVSLMKLPVLNKKLYYNKCNNFRTKNALKTIQKPKIIVIL